ncbi:DUF5672 family protein [Salmonirosea aquatica]|uniref:DUF5672 domain-containing protein n=1 Tax=Salmonirosea aquatica TaxID=2654236 RepID=A0A7C9BLF7_9BACT|nr:hypothetical protein [Cytophagaceae bacterium SJW1-29]
MTELVTVLVPLFGLPLTPLETYSLQTCQRHLGDFPITFLKSDSLTLSDEVRSICPTADSVSFDPRYLANRTGYTKLLLGENLYEQFSWSRYLLILELNTVVTKNELAYWCRQGYDLIQAFPTFDEKVSPVRSMVRRFSPTAHLAPQSYERQTFERSAGISLRRVKSFQKLVRRKKRSMNRFLTDYPDPQNDSLFWEYFVNRWRPELITPNALARRHFAQNQASFNRVPAPNLIPFSITDFDDFPLWDRY